MNTGNWYHQQERGAGKFRLGVLFWIYKIFGIRFIKLCVWGVAGCIGLCAKQARCFSHEYREILNKYQVAHNTRPTRFSALRHIRMFAYSCVDKMVAMCDARNPIKFVVDNNDDWRELQNLIRNKHGAFLICNHVGNIEALAAFPDANNVKMHAFQQVRQNGIFHQFISSHSVRKNTIIHSVEGLNIGTAAEMFDYINNGDLVMMAGDRISAATPGKTVSVKMLGRECDLPAGVFRFARSMSCPIFAVALVNIGHEKYKLFVRRLDDKNVDNMATAFAKFTEQIVLSAPIQWFNFYKFFK